MSHLDKLINYMAEISPNEISPETLEKCKKKISLYLPEYKKQSRFVRIHNLGKEGEFRLNIKADACSEVFVRDLESFLAIDFARHTTDKDGKLRLKLDGGDYKITVRRGPEYDTFETIVTLNEDTSESVINVNLTRHTNMQENGYICGDIHHHSVYSSPKYGGTDEVWEDTDVVALSMMAAGLNFGALSDHHNILNHESWLAQTNKDFLAIPSKEISTSRGHVIALDARKDVIFHIPEDEKKTDEYMKSEFLRIINEIKDLGGVAQLNHPCERSKSISWNRDFDDIIGNFDTYEIWNGSAPMMKNTLNGDAFMMYLDLLGKGVYLPVTSGSDTHNTNPDMYHEMMQIILEDDELFEVFSGVFDITSDIIKNKLSSGDVRTYVKISDIEIIEDLPEPKCANEAGALSDMRETGDALIQKIKAALKTGASFVTNGPLLLVEDGKISVRSLKPLTEVFVYTKEGKTKLDFVESKDGDVYCYLFDTERFNKDKWFVFVASSLKYEHAIYSKIPFLA